MMTLADMDCAPPKEDEDALGSKEIERLHEQVPQWEITQEQGVKHLERTFEFADFEQALGFTNQVGEMAEEQDHHPRLTTEWGEVTVTWWTHKVGGLYRNDFIAAAKTDRIYERFSA